MAVRGRAQYAHFNPHLKRVRDVHHKILKPPPAADIAETVAGKSGKVAEHGHEPGQIPLVHDVMVGKVFYCFENQSIDEARKIMREQNVQYLLVLNNRLQVVGIVTMRDLRPGSGYDRPSDA